MALSQKGNLLAPVTEKNQSPKLPSGTAQFRSFKYVIGFRLPYLVFSVLAPLSWLTCSLVLQAFNLSVPRIESLWVSFGPVTREQSNHCDQRMKCTSWLDLGHKFDSASGAKGQSYLNHMDWGCQRDESPKKNLGTATRRGEMGAGQIKTPSETPLRWGLQNTPQSSWNSLEVVLQDLLWVESCYHPLQIPVLMF